MKVLAIILALAVSQACTLAAQKPNDSLRVRLRTGSDWLYGRLVRSDSVNLYLRSQAQEQAIPLANVRRAQVRQHQSVARNAIVYGVGAAAGSALFFVLNPSREPLSGESKASYVATSGLAGALGGAIGALIIPNYWAGVRIRPGILPQPIAP